MDINEKVLLLAILKKLKKEEFLSDSFLTLKGDAIAKNIEQEFKI